MPSPTPSLALRLLFGLCAVSFGCVQVDSAAPDAPAPRTRPNIVFIMADDHAVAAYGAYGSRFGATPHLDRLAKEGVRFDRCFATNAICTPSRAAMLTGKYAHKNGVTAFDTFDGSQPHLAKMLRESGYFTGVVGKWHLGSEPTGFDRWTVLPGQGAYHDPVFLGPEGRVTLKGYVTDRIGDLAERFIEDRPKDRPFFLMCHHKAPHRPWEPPVSATTDPSGREIPVPPTFDDDYAGRGDALRENRQRIADDLTRRDLKLVPPAGLSPKERATWLDTVPRVVDVETRDGVRRLEGRALVAWKYRRYMEDYLACVESLDASVGRLLATLDRLGLAENTLVVYTSDQGFFLGEHGLYDKRFMYEPSIRMPFVARWPHVIAPGSSTDALAINVDVAPTLLEVAGVPRRDDMQGRSLVPLLRGERPDDWRTSFYYRYYHDPGDHDTRAHFGVRTETHKLIRFPTKGQWELYDLVADPLEMRNRADDPEMRPVRAALEAELERLRRDLGDTAP